MHTPHRTIGIDIAMRSNWKHDYRITIADRMAAIAAPAAYEIELIGMDGTLISTFSLGELERDETRVACLVWQLE